ncbi:MAG: DNA/RNA non-specific endonuclease [Liquorilactobacillus nagelii]|jgi:DNA-entry nuclease|uniref:Hydroxyacid dehydrogenase n=2 Tax=Liquorilactobacillus nagelii TaxID=82688 RepID=A0A3S6QUG2_9LACO|nr:DNA/RNA non-specific endonuclease [Liquorilactobacillus nagelii]AUJ31786.1 hydroxyacid dehydrogenase [Liquorilactobacillus nagelii]MCC7615839.1 hydroxyacid dehydrogenase [Liquorilactobacillus nagelii]MCP9314145.1 DNA/RNA non-specific endonuclease [Liquorilactobacillus nagelii]
MKKIIQILIATGLVFLVCMITVQPTVQAVATEQQQISKLQKQLKKTKHQITFQNRRIKYWHQKLASIATSGATTVQNSSTVQNETQQLAEKDYSGQNEITINNNTPNFTTTDLRTVNGAWQTYSNLDRLNRAGVANALLNKSLMPTVKRTELTWNPTGWHNKKIASGWLYNRSHLIGYQLSGQNNNPKNLITGTRELNAPEMLAHEDDIAYYLKQNPNGYVRYRVTPIFRGNELLPRGVQMEAQSVGSNAVHFNVYIFNVQSGVTLNYQDGTSRIN